MNFNSLRTKILLIFILFLISFAGYHFLKTKLKQNEISDEVKVLQAQIDEFEKKNESLEKLSEYLKTDDFKEKEAKEKLSLVKEGEKVIIVKKDEIEKEISEATQNKPEVKIERPNYYYWWHYFFGIKPETSSANSFEE